MSQHTATRTATCPAFVNVHVKGDFPEQDTSTPCEGENEVEITFGWCPEQKEGWGDAGGTEPIAAHAEDVEVPEITCEWCGHEFTQVDLDAIAATFDPRED